MSIERRYALIGHQHVIDDITDLDLDLYAKLADNEVITGNWEFDGTVAFDGAVDIDAALDVTGVSTFTGNVSITGSTFATGAPALRVKADDARIYIEDSAGTANTKIHSFRMDNDILQFSARSDDDATGNNWLQVHRTTTTPTSIRIPQDNLELRLGASGDDLALYHDGTDSYIDNNTGTFVIRNTVNGGTIGIQTSDGSQRNRFFASSTITNMRGPNGTVQMEVDNDAAYTSLPGGTTLRPLLCAFNPYKIQNENASRDVTRADVGTTMNVASGTVTYTLQDEAEAGWVIGDTIEFSAQATTLTIATEGGGIRTWRGDGAAITTETSISLNRAGRVLLQFIGGDLWDIVRGSEFLNALGPDWTVTNVSTNRSCDANGLLAAIGDNLATLINDLIAQGILQ